MHHDQHARSFMTPAIVLKRSNIGETDRLITLLTQKQGKIVAVAKGVRQIKSSKRAILEPGNLVKGFFITTKSLPLLTQATLIDDAAAVRDNLASIRRLSQILEIFDKLLVEEELEGKLFSLILTIRQDTIQQRPFLQIKNKLSQLINQLGFSSQDDNPSPSIAELVAQITEKPMRSYEFLKV